MTKSSTRSLGSLSESTDRGFTLIELLIVIVILGVLAGITVFAVQNFTSTSVQAACKADYKSVEVAVEAYKAQTGQYPTAGVTGSHGIPAAVAPPDPKSDAVTTTNGFLAGDTFDTPNLGPWLRDQPTNGTHYRIEVPLNGALNGTGQVEVWNSTGTATIPAVSTNSAADCTSVK